MLEAIIVDDEENNIDNLAFILQNDCKEVSIVGKAMNAQEARIQLNKKHVDVIFLDINMPGESGFELLQSLGDHNYKIVFVTAYNEYSLQAIKACAVDYLLKPLQIEEVQLAVEKLNKALQHDQTNEMNKMLLQNFMKMSQQHQIPKRIALPQLGSITYLDVDDIISLQADGNYTIIHKKNLQKMVISKTLKDFEEILDPKQFIRIHKSYIINLCEVKEYSTQDGGMAKMNDGNEWSVSRRQAETFLTMMNESSLLFKKIN